MPLYATLLTRSMRGSVDLVQFLAGRPPPDVAERTVACAEEMVRAAHAAGIVLLGAKYRNILVPNGGASDASELALIDQPDLAWSWSSRLRAKDLRLMERDRQRYLVPR